MMANPDERKLTGKHVALIFATAFGVIIAANMVLTITAVRSFSGLVVGNSYIASQSFNDKKAAQDALNWSVVPRVESKRLYLDMTDETGARVETSQIGATIGRPTSYQSDKSLTLEPTETGYAAPIDLAPGRWRLIVNATAPDGTPFEQRHAIFIRASE